ncbi:MAG: hypothetical protein FWC78_06510 [Defluviitaleaceae bacterium]|nr:hypothetical protein [Defluviitaleaceae bacterium]
MKEFKKYCNKHFPGLSRFKKFKLACDCLKEYFVYGTRVNNYFLYEFYNKTKSERRAFFTLGEGWNYRRKVNGKEVHQKLKNKRMFNETFSAFIQRDWLYMAEATQEQFDKFCASHTTYIEKPVNMMNGDGIKIRDASDDNNVGNYQMYAGKPILLEEVVVACDVINDLHPTSLNTIRVSTMLDKSRTKVTIIAATLRIGTGGKIIDDFGAESLAAAIDVGTGVISHMAVDKMGNRYKSHPDTGQLILGIAIPGWQKVIDLCTKAALSYPDAPFIGWDVAVSPTKDGQDHIIQIIEGNDGQCFLLIQAPGCVGLKEKIMRAAE